MNEINNTDKDEKNRFCKPNLREAIRILFDDILSLSKHNREVFKDLYYDREDKFKIFDSIIWKMQIP